MAKPITTCLRNKDAQLGLLLSVGGLIGLLDILLGDWRRGPGIGPHLMPEICYILFLFCGLVLVAHAYVQKREVIRPAAQDPRLWQPYVLFFGLAVGYVLLLLKVGLIVATGVYTWIMFTSLSSNRIEDRRSIGVATLIATLLIWILFTHVNPLVLPDPLLF